MGSVAWVADIRRQERFGMSDVTLDYRAERRPTQVRDLVEVTGGIQAIVRETSPVVTSKGAIQRIGVSADRWEGLRS